ncbi:HPr family phosphocarrier protein [Candidatus Pacearchaeota archaeon]|nr:HPr family phosphocarrier protein [Candidatus Pacearchaeota archaeon]
MINRNSPILKRTLDGLVGAATVSIVGIPYFLGSADLYEWSSIMAVGAVGGLVIGRGLDALVQQNKKRKEERLTAEEKRKQLIEDERIRELNSHAPRVYLQGGYTIYDYVPVNVPIGLHAVPCCGIVHRSTLYPGKVRIKNLTTQDSPSEANAKSIMGLLTIEAYEGSKLRISVEGESKEAITLAEELYHAIAVDPKDLDKFSEQYRKRIRAS